MKSGTIIFNAVNLILIAILFYLHFSQKSEKKDAAQQAITTTNVPFKIAYFEIDTIMNSFSLVKDVQNELSVKEGQINSEFSRLDKMFRDKGLSYQRQAQTTAMNQVQSEAAQRDLMQTDQDIKKKKAQLEQEYQDLKMRKNTELKSKIERFLKEYNQTKGYAYIFANEPELFFYYRDTAYDITADVIKGLNELYSKKK
jgi:outer membrane protein